MSWSAWSQATAAPAALGAAAQIPATVQMPAQCTPEQWATMQQQNWQQWMQWQQQYQQWQQQYGEQYQKLTMQNATAAAPVTPVASVVPVGGVAMVSAPPLPTNTALPPPPAQHQVPPLPPAANTAVPPPPPETKPPPPPDDYQQPPPFANNKPLVFGKDGRPTVYPTSAPNANYQQTSASKPTTYQQSTVKSTTYQGSNYQSSSQDYGRHASDSFQSTASAGYQDFGTKKPDQWSYSNQTVNKDFSVPPPSVGSQPPSLLSLKVNMPGESSTETQGQKRKFNSDNQFESWNRDAGNNTKTSRWSGSNKGYENKTDNRDSRFGNRDFNATPTKSTTQEFESSTPKVNKETLSDAEKNFDIQFAAWEAQFNKWKEQNANHPDKRQYKEYEAKWENWRKQLLDRREQMRRKRLGLPSTGGQKTDTQKTTEGSSKSFSNEDDFDKSFDDFNIKKNESQKSGPKNDERVENVSSDINKSDDSAKNENSEFGQLPKEQRKRRNSRVIDLTESEQLQTNASAGLFPSNNSSGIPGLDLVDENSKKDQQEPDNDDQNKQSRPDLEAISRNINNILGDEKLLSMLSMVSKNQSPTAQQLPPHVNLQQPPPRKDINIEIIEDKKISQGGGLPSLLDLPMVKPPSLPPQAQDAFNKNSDNSFNKGPANWSANSSFNQESTNVTADNNLSAFSQGVDDFNRAQGGNVRDSGNHFNRGSGNWNANSSFNQEGTNFNEDSTSGYNQGPGDFNRAPGSNVRGPGDSFNRGASNWSSNSNFNQEGTNYNKGPGDFNKPLDNSARGPNNSFNRGPTDTFNRGPNDKLNMGGPPGNFNRAPGLLNRDSRDNYNRSGPGDNFNRSGPNDNFNRGGPSDNFNRGGPGDNFNRGGPGDNFNRGRPGDNFNRSGPGDNFNRSGPGDNFNRSGPGDNFNRGGPSENFNRGGPGDNFNRDGPGDDLNRSGPGDNFNRSGPGDNFNRSGNFNRNSADNFNKGGPGGNFNRGAPGDNFNRGGPGGNFGRDIPPDNFNQSPGSNFNQDNLNRGPNDLFRRPPGNLFNRSPADNFGFRSGSDNFNCDPKDDKSPQNRDDNFGRKPLFERGGPNDFAKNRPGRALLPDPVDQRPGQFLPQDRPRLLGDASKPITDQIGPTSGNSNTNVSPFSNKPQQTAAPKDWGNEPILAPVTVVDYDHRPVAQQDAEIAFVEPMQTFEYNHESKNFVDPFKKDEDESKLRMNKPRYDDRSPYGGDRSFGRDRVDRYGSRGDYESSRYDRNDSLYEKREPYFNKKDSFYDKRDDSRRKLSPVPDKNTFSNRLMPRRENERVMFNKNTGGEFSGRPNFPIEDYEYKSNTKEDKGSAVKINKQNVTLIEDLLTHPGRANRPQRIVIILRGPPGSGKTFLAKLIKDKEVEQGGSAPRILSLDDYFMVEVEKDGTDPDTGRKIKIKEMVYEYEQAMECHYITSLVKAFKKTVSDGYFNFIIVDCVNDKVLQYEDMWSFAKQRGFQVYVCQMELDVQACTKRNVHGRTEEQVERLVKSWEKTPAHHLLLDATSLLQAGCIDEVEMDDVQIIENSDIDGKVTEVQDDEDNSNDDGRYKSKWETMDHTVDKLARLDGTNKPLLRNQSMKDYLQLDDGWDEREARPGQKRVRWADIEERRKQEKMRAIGFVVGQTDWDRMMDPSQGSDALTQTKFIEPTRKRY